MTGTDRAPGALVISLDLELHWGVRDRQSGASPYRKNLLGARAAIPRLLELFEEFEIAATWAVVGFLFAESREELEELSPNPRPSYRNRSLWPFGQPIGENEDEDPLHYAPSLIARIQHTPRQEIGTHTFSHYYCLEEGQSREEFRADLAAAVVIAGRRGIRPRSIVFPRNQHNPDYDGILIEEGIRAFRGNPRSPVWEFTGGRESRAPWRRAGRLVDVYFGSRKKGPVPWNEIPQPSGLSEVRASHFLQPYGRFLPALERFRLERLRRSLRYAAARKHVVHLWWHPHNFGSHTDENLGFLRQVLREFASCRDRHGMRSLSMLDVDRRLREETGSSVSRSTDGGTVLSSSERPAP